MGDSKNLLIILVAVAIVISAVSTIAILSSLIQQPTAASGTAGEVKLYVTPRPQTTSGEVSLFVISPESKGG